MGVRRTGADLETVVELFEDLQEALDAFDAGGAAALTWAVRLYRGFPLMLELVGFEQRERESDRELAGRFLLRAHSHAAEVLAAEAAKRGFDGGAVLRSMTLCRDLLSTDPLRFYRVPRLRWPDCLADARGELPESDRAALREADAAVGGIAAGVAVPDAAPTGEQPTADALASLLQPAIRELADALTASRAGQPTGGQPTADLRLWNQLTDRQRDCLRVLAERKATDADSRLTAEQLARLVLGARGQPEALKEPLGDLVTRGLVESKSGRGGGYWLSERGRGLLAAVDRDPGAREATDRPAVG